MDMGMDPIGRVPIDQRPMDQPKEAEPGHLPPGLLQEELERIRQSALESRGYHERQLQSADSTLTACEAALGQLNQPQAKKAV